MNRPVTCSSVMTRAADAPSALGRRMKRSILFGMRISAFIALPSLARDKLQRDREAEIGDERERMRRIDGERREQREHLAQEVILAARSFPSWSPPDRRPARCPLGEHRRAAPASAPAGRWRAPTTASAMRASCSAGVRPSGLLVVMPARSWPLQAGDADHEEFVEVVGRDREEPHPLEQRMGGVFGLFEHPAIEMQPGQLAVDEPLRARRKRRRPQRSAASRQRNLRRFFSNNNGLRAIHGRKASDGHDGRHS